MGSPWDSCHWVYITPRINSRVDVQLIWSDFSCFSTCSENNISRQLEYFKYHSIMLVKPNITFNIIYHQYWLPIYHQYFDGLYHPWHSELDELELASKSYPWTWTNFHLTRDSDTKVASNMRKNPWKVSSTCRICKTIPQTHLNFWHWSLWGFTSPVSDVTDVLHRPVVRELLSFSRVLCLRQAGNA